MSIVPLDLHKSKVCQYIAQTWSTDIDWLYNRGRKCNS